MKKIKVWDELFKTSGQCICCGYHRDESTIMNTRSNKTSIICKACFLGGTLPSVYRADNEDIWYRFYTKRW